MPQTRQNGAVVPINSDEYNLTADLATLADSLDVNVVVANLAARNALTPYEGMVVLRLDLNGLTQTYVNGAWRTNYAAPYRQWFAIATFSVGGVGDTLDVNLPAGLFTVAPLVQLTKQSAGGAGYIPYVASATTTKITVGVYWPGNTVTGYTVSLGIHAMQANPNTAGGLIAP
jgi:hypothetical protein